MKELSIEQKAKAYDEAIKKVNDYYEGKTKLYSDVDKTLDYLFPVLKESEDERIRKDIISHFAKGIEGSSFDEVREKYRIWIAWLEKQGELVNSLSKGLDNAYERIDGLIQENNSLIEQLEKQSEQNLNNVYDKELSEILNHIICKYINDLNIPYAKREIVSREIIPYVERLEKQSKNNTGISETTKQELENNLNKALEKETPESLNKFIDEQKPADKVEQKFHKGNWIVSPNGVYWHINAVWNGRYEVTSTDGICANRPLNTSLYHLWTIQDAKDGDVLSYRNGQWIFILKRIIDKDSFEYYALWSITHNDLTINDSAFSLLINSIHPAAKEQCDLLFQKMKEAGYEWDAEKLELKSIESAEWSEDDEKMLECALDMIEWYSGKNEDKSRLVSGWLKSLKEKYNWKPSDEQMKALSAINVTGGVSYAGQGQELINLYNDLKKLRENKL